MMNNILIKLLSICLGKKPSFTVIRAILHQTGLSPDLVALYNQERIFCSSNLSDHLLGNMLGRKAFVFASREGYNSSLLWGHRPLRSWQEHVRGRWREQEPKLFSNVTFTKGSWYWGIVNVFPALKFYFDSQSSVYFTCNYSLSPIFLRESA